MRDCRFVVEGKWPFSRYLLLAVIAICGCARQSEPDPRRTPIVAAVENALPSVANIGTERIVRTVYDDPLQRTRERLREQLFSDFFGRPPPSEYKPGHSLGSGVVVHPNGFILTNYHVIERASTIYVTVGRFDNSKAKLLAGDPVSDLALIGIDVDEPLDPIEFARDDDLLLGEQVIVLGNPYGLSQSVTVGVLSSKEREARHNGDVIFKDILQTDAAVNPGSSGGPMLNINGELIGINIAVYKDAQNIGFAVPVKRVRRLLEHWLSPEFLYRRTLGIAVEDVDGSLEVVAVYRDDSAAAGGIEPGERVVAVNGVAVDNLTDYRNEVLKAALAGELVEIGLDSMIGHRSVGLAWLELPKPSGELLARERLGLVLSAQSGGEGVQSDRGLVIEDVVSGSAAARSGLYPGLHLLAVDGQPVRGLQALGEALENVRSGDKVSLVLAGIEEEGAFRIVRQTSMELTAD